MTRERAIATVLGEVAPGDLGVVLPHEHLLVDATAYWAPPADAELAALAGSAPVALETLHLVRRNLFLLRDNLLLDDVDVAVAEVERFRALGGGTIVDVSLPDIGRDPRGLQEIARRTGVNVVMGCGHYIHLAHPPGLDEEPLEAIEERLVRELTEGVGDTGVRPGLIGEIGTWYPLHPTEEKVLRAAARAQRATGVALNVHLHVAARSGHDILDILDEEGVDPARVVLDHLDLAFGHLDVDVPEVLAYHRSLAARGCYVAYDTVGEEAIYSPGGPGLPAFWTPLDLTRARGVAHLLEHGYGDQVLLSHDVFTKCMLVRYGGFGYAHLLRDFQGHLRAEGLGDDDLHRLFVENPRRMLTPAG